MSGSESEAGLGRQVERLSRQVVKTDSQVRSLAKALQRLTEQIAAGAPAGETPGESAGEDREPPGPLPSWLVTVDFPDAVKMIEVLEPWLKQVYLRYPASALPTCWAWHPWLVEELWWLRNAWCDAYGGPKASWQKVGDWHDRQRPNVVKRVEDAVQGTGTACGLGKHVDPAGDPPLPLPDALPHVLTAWCSPDRAAWPPAPTADQLAEARRHEQAAIQASIQRRTASRR